MDDKIKYRIATRLDYSAVLLLYNKMYNSNRSLSDFEWLLEANPAGKAVLIIALMEDKVVGMQSLIPYLFLRDGQVVETFKSEDTLVDKEYRGTGIFTKLYEMVHALSAEKLVWGLTDKKDILARVAMPSSERLTIVVSVKRPSLDYKKHSFRKYVAKSIFYFFLYLKSSFRTEEVQSHLTLRNIKLNDFDYEDLKKFFIVLSKADPNILYPFISEDYLKWRLADNPNLKDYQVVCSFNDRGEIVICSLIGLEDKNAYWQSFYVLDEVPMSDRVAHIAILKQNLFNSGVDLIHSWLFECNSKVREVKHLFYRAGFSKVRDGLWIVHNSSGKEIHAHELYFSPQLGIR